MANVVVLKIYKSGELVAEKQLNQDHIVLGSSESEAHVTLPGDASPIHASIEKRDGKYVLCDLGSEKGTYKNDDKILEAELKPGDKIVAGEFSIEFFIQEVPDAVASTMNQEAPAQEESAPAEESQPVAQEPQVAEPSPAPAAQEEPAPVAVAAAAGGGVATVVSKQTFSPDSAHKDINEFIRPTKGTLVEVLVAWKERVISAYHFSDKGTINIGTHPSCEVIVPIISTSANKVPLVQIGHQASVIVHPGMEGVLVSDQQNVSFSQLASMGRSGQSVTLQQGELARIQVGGGVEVVVRYASQAPKPVVVPFIDLSSNGFLAVLLAIVLSGILSLYVALNRIDNIDKLDEEEFRTALIITNPPKPPPQPKIKLPPPPKEKKKAKPIVKKKKPPKKKKKKVKLDIKKKQRKRVAKKTKKKGGGVGGQRAKGSGRDADPK
ncbi:MAG: FHA domain-containing protein, partial [Bdellovibrionales bacterium]|nr:FHA domain-containing protein [Bdellovibrionales bacterium]NQZ19052.1 FHA domain-containing protein [Bdellovibrionales bacterium]